MEVVKKDKVVFVIGSTGTGKTKLATEIGKNFPAEIINSDKIQVYKGLPIVTNKVSDDEAQGVTHHLIGVIEPELDFTVEDFRRMAMLHIESIIARGNIPVIAGGSNSFIEELVEGGDGKFKSKYNCCFLWVDVSLIVLFPYLAKRIDKMIEAGLVEEVMGTFHPEIDDYTRGIRRAIGVPELHGYFRKAAAAPVAGNKDTQAMLEKAVDLMKVNTCKLAECQVRKIYRLQTLPGWNVHRLDATEVLAKDREEPSGEKAWEELVRRPGLELVRQFLEQEENNGIISSTAARSVTSSGNGSIDCPNSMGDDN